MTSAERTEAAVMSGLALGWAAIAPLRWAGSLPVVVGWFAALLLAQGLVRDVVKLAVTRARSKGGRQIRCLCAESTVGLLLLSVALALVLCGIDQPIALGRIAVLAGPPSTLLFGFFAKDYVVSIRKETDHASVIVW